MLREITTTAELRRSCADDGLLMWASQGFPTVGRRVRAWRCGDAVAVAAPYLSCRDRLAVHGPPDQAATLVTDVLQEVGTTYRLIGTAELVEAVAGRVDGLTLFRTFGWMQTDGHPPAERRERRPPAPAQWLDCGWSAPIAELLAEVYPGSYARPGLVGVRRWAGAVTPDGTLAAVAADAWSAPDVGYVAGVAARASLQGQGYAAAAFGHVLGTLVATHGRVALMVNAANRRAVALYRSCGLAWRPVAAAALGQGPRCEPHSRRAPEASPV